MNKNDLKLYQEFAEQLVREAGKILVSYRGKAKIKTRKSDYGDIATEADYASETYLISEIKKKFPEHNILSEESGDSKVSSDYTWIIDPLDGTKEFNRLLPMYNVTVALEFKDEVVAGVAYRPESNELYSSAKDCGAYLNGNKMHVSDVDELSKSFIAVSFPTFNISSDDAHFTWQVIHNLVKKAYRVRPFPECLANLCWTGLGAYEGYVLTYKLPKWWDVAAGILMATESGGKVTNMYGEPIKNRDLTKGLVASNGILHDQILEIIKEAR